MQPIPKAMREELAKLPRMKKCHNCNSTENIEWNHALIYSGRQINEIFAIVALCKKCHRGNNGTIFPEAKHKCELFALKNGMDILKIKYPKAISDWEYRLRYLKYLYEF